MAREWTSPVVQWLNAGGDQKFEADNFARVFLLGSIIQDTLPDDRPIRHLLASYEALLKDLGSLNATAFAQSRSPFLMMAANRSLEMIASGDTHGLRIALGSLVLHMFDSYFHRLSDSCSIEIDSVFSDQLVHLPNLGIRVHVKDGGTLRIVKSNKNAVAFVSPAATIKLPLARADENAKTYRFRYEWIPGEFTLILESGPTLFEPEYIGKCFPDIPEPRRLSRLVTDALDVIFAVWPELEASALTHSDDSRWRGSCRQAWSR